MLRRAAHMWRIMGSGLGFILFGLGGLLAISVFRWVSMRHAHHRSRNLRRGKVGTMRRRRRGFKPPQLDRYHPHHRDPSRSPMRCEKPTLAKPIPRERGPFRWLYSQ